MQNRTWLSSFAGYPGACCEPGLLVHKESVRRTAWEPFHQKKPCVRIFYFEGRWEIGMKYSAENGSFCNAWAVETAQPAAASSQRGIPLSGGPWFTPAPAASLLRCRGHSCGLGCVRRKDLAELGSVTQPLRSCPEPQSALGRELLQVTPAKGSFCSWYFFSPFIFLIPLLLCNKQSNLVSSRAIRILL